MWLIENPDAKGARKQGSVYKEGFIKKLRLGERKRGCLVTAGFSTEHHEKGMQCRRNDDDLALTMC